MGSSYSIPTHTGLWKTVGYLAGDEDGSRSLLVGILINAVTFAFVIWTLFKRLPKGVKSATQLLAL
jgi:hypothetical protein